MFCLFFSLYLCIFFLCSEKAPLTISAQEDVKIVYYRALYPFESRSHDEISIQPGDIVMVRRDCDITWYNYLSFCAFVIEMTSMARFFTELRKIFQWILKSCVMTSIPTIIMGSFLQFIVSVKFKQSMSISYQFQHAELCVSVNRFKNVPIQKLSQWEVSCLPRYLRNKVAVIFYWKSGYYVWKSKIGFDKVCF